MERREDSRRRRRRRRRSALVVIVIVGLAIAAVLWQPWRGWGAPRAPLPAAAASASSSPGVDSTLPDSPAPAANSSPSAAVTAAGAVAGASSAPGQAQVVAPAIVQDLVPYGPQRKAQMATFSLRHYGQDTWVLRPQVIVLHYTATSTYAAAHNTFAANAPALGELPGVAAHFVIDENGTIYQQVPLDVRCRHTVGLDWCAVGVEFVQPAASGPSQAIAQIFSRPRQVEAGLRLVAWLQATYDIGSANVIGHAMANSAPQFKDLLGQRNDHVDWNAAAVARFRQALVSAE
jgi:N-acetylmuramoyl-L-alanine amidase